MDLLRHSRGKELLLGRSSAFATKLQMQSVSQPWVCIFIFVVLTGQTCIELKLLALIQLP
jgi:hypothetical protein